MDRQALLIVGAGAVILSDLCVHDSQGGERPGDTLPVAHFSEQRQGFLRQGAGRDAVTFHQGDDTQEVEREGNALLISQFAEQCKPLPAVGFGSIKIILSAAHYSGANETLCPPPHRSFTAL